MVTADIIVHDACNEASCEIRENGLGEQRCCWHHGKGTKKVNKERVIDATQAVQKTFEVKVHELNVDQMKCVLTLLDDKNIPVVEIDALLNGLSPMSATSSKGMRVLLQNTLQNFNEFENSKDIFLKLTATDWNKSMNPTNVPTNVPTTTTTTTTTTTVVAPDVGGGDVVMAVPSNEENEENNPIGEPIPFELLDIDSLEASDHEQDDVANNDGSEVEETLASTLSSLEIVENETDTALFVQISSVARGLANKSFNPTTYTCKIVPTKLPVAEIPSTLLCCSELLEDPWLVSFKFFNIFYIFIFFLIFYFSDEKKLYLIFFFSFFLLLSSSLPFKPAENVQWNKYKMVKSC